MTVLSLDEIHEHLNITEAINDSELLGFLEAAEAMIAERVGPLEPTEFTSTVYSGSNGLTLPAKPVLSIISITAASGAVYVPADLLVDGQTGEVTTSAGYDLLSGRYTVTYEAGYPDFELPESLRLAIKELVRHFWERSQRGRSSRRGTDDQAATATYLIPNFVQGLLEPHQKYRLGLV